MARGEPRRALELVRPCLARTGRSPQTRPLLTPLGTLAGECAARLGDPESAEELFRSALAAARGAEAIRPRVGRAAALLAMGDSAAAVASLEAAGEALARDDEGRFLLAEALLQEGRVEKARALLERLVRDAPSSEAFHRLGVIRYESRDREGALAALREAIRLRPDDYYSRIYAARVHLDRRAAPEAGRLLEEARSIAETPEVLYLLARVERARDHPREELKLLRRATALDPEYSEALFALARAERIAGSAAAAKDALDRFRRARQKEEKYQRAAQRLEQKGRSHPADAAAPLALARLHFAAGHDEAAERSAWKAVRLAPREPEPRLLLARALARQGLYTEADVQYRRILRRRPEHAVARQEWNRLVRDHARPKNR